MHRGSILSLLSVTLLYIILMGGRCKFVVYGVTSTNMMLLLVCFLFCFEF